jgi:hypothetical protein
MPYRRFRFKTFAKLSPSAYQRLNHSEDSQDPIRRWKPEKLGIKIEELDRTSHNSNSVPDHILGDGVSIEQQQ